MHFFQKHNTTAAFKIAGGADLGASRSDSKQRPVPSVFTTKISKTFLDALYAFLDGLGHLASVDYKFTQEVVRSEAGKKPNPIAAKADLSNVDVRILLVISNLGYLSRSLIPSMINQLEAAFSTSIANERRTLVEVVTQLDKTLFDEFTRSKIVHLNQTMRHGILESGLDWYETPRPTEVRAYIYEALTYLVQIHAQISEVARPLLDRALNTIVDEVVQDSLGCFKQIKRFGMGGMLRATLEIEFFHQTLMRFCTPAAVKTLTEIYETISRSYQRKPGQTEDLQRELDGVKKTLNDTRRATQIEFLCFKSPKKDKGEPRKDREGTVERPERDRTAGSRPP
ncbi:hypothetical protein FRC09_014486, partial [Ceratobasidium sp. 395]